MSRPQRFRAETIDQFMCIGRATDDGQGRCVIEFDGQLEQERLERAVRLTLEAEPVLGCHFVERPRRPYWERDESVAGRPLLHCFPTDDAQGALYRFMAEPSNPAEAPQVRVGLVRSGQDTLCVKVNHMIADAGGLMDYVALLAHTYRQLESNPDYQPAHDARARRGQGQVLARIGASTLLRACRRFSFGSSAWGFPALGADVSERTFALRQLGPERLAAVKAYAHARQVKANLVFLTAFSRALFDIAAPPEGVPLPVQVSVSLRRYLDACCPRGVCNLTGGYFPAFRMRRGESFEEMLREVEAVMRAHEADQTWLAATVFSELSLKLGFAPIRAIMRYLFSRDIKQGKLHPGFANLGSINPNDVEFGGARVRDVVLFGPVAYPPGFGLSINSFCGKLSLTTGYCASTTEPRLVEHFLDRVVEELPR